MKDRLQFFASEEWNREMRGTVRAAFVPTAAERAGDFSGPAIAGCTLPAPLDPLTGQPFPGNQIPQDRLSAGGHGIPAALPAAEHDPGRRSCNNWVTSLNSPINWRQENIRLDYELTAATRMMVRYTQDSLDERRAEQQRQPLGRRSVPRGGLELGPAGQVVRRLAEPDDRLDARSTASSSPTRPTRSP